MKEGGKKAGIKFRLKDFRSTFATQTARIDPNLIPDVSTALGHTSIETTQRFYAQMDRESAGRRIEEAWKYLLELVITIHITSDNYASKSFS